MQNNWKEELSDEYFGQDMVVAVTLNGEVATPQMIRDFIETEIIEKLWNDLEQLYILRDLDPDKYQQLRAKWLGGHNA